MIAAEFLGAAEAAALLRRLTAGVSAAADGQVSVETDIVYAWGMEFGNYRDGKLARKAGGSFALTSSFSEVTGGGYLGALQLSVFRGASAVQDVMLKAAADIQAGAAVKSPRDTGTLAASFQIVPGFR